MAGSQEDSFLQSVLESVQEDEGAPLAGSAAAAGRQAGQDIGRAQRQQGGGPAAAGGHPQEAGGAAGEGDMGSALAQMMREMQDPEFQTTLQSTLGHMASGGETGAASGGLFAGVGGAEGSGNELDTNIARTLDLMQRLAQNQAGNAAAEKLSDEITKSMMEEFESMGKKEDFQEIVDNMMQQLLSKEVMYEPIKEICARFPEWLGDHAETLPEQEYENYGKMYQTFQRLVAVYETEPDNFPRLQELMQDLQECGQPPREIVEDLAPGLQFGEDGMPVLPAMGGLPTDMPGAGCAVM